jgi:uncharacterized membrane protein
MTGPAVRRTYLDVLRGVAVLIMMEAHIVDSWTHTSGRASKAFGESLILGGFGAPLFLFLAGIAVPLSGGSKARRLGDEDAAARLVEKRGFQIFLLAFLFRLQAVVISRSPLWTLLKVDILNIMGPAIAITAYLWGRFRSPRARTMAFAAATAGIALATPIVRGMTWLGALPPFAQGYLRPVPGWTNFTFFPWAAFVTGGAIIGTLLDGTSNPWAERRVNIRLAISGLAIGAAAYAASFLPSVYAQSSFWTSSPCFFFIRAGVMTMGVAVAFAWERRPSARRWSPLRLMGRSSLFIYWIHVEMVYGVMSTPLHHALTLPQSWIGLALFSAVMVLCALAKDRVKSWWRQRPVRGRPLAPQRAG